ncbi:MAG: single-stranded DNA-binding protein [Cyclobacteriaceae bacterium]
MSKTTKTTATEQNQNDDQQEALFADTNITWKSGNLVRDPELVADGAYLKLRIAANKQFKNKEGELKTNTNYFNVLVSSKLEKVFSVATEFKKGDWIFLKGEDGTKSIDTLQGYKETACTIYPFEVGLKKAKSQPEQSQEKEAVPEPA